VIAEVKTPHSYLVDLPNGARRHVHINNLRPFIARVQSVTYDSDVDFGHVVAAPTSDNRGEVVVLMPSQIIERACMSHLTNEQQEQLLQLLDRFAVCFSDKPGLCKVIEHDIVTVDGFQPKQAKPYKLPESLKPLVDKQIEDLLVQGIIKKSTSPMTSPIVCVLKMQGGVRLAVDYRYLNSYTRPDPMPMSDTEHVMAAIGNARFISVFDCTSGYW
jgi:hypothetical protein